MQVELKLAWECIENSLTVGKPVVVSILKYAWCVCVCVCVMDGRNTSVRDQAALRLGGYFE